VSLPQFPTSSAPPQFGAGPPPVLVAIGAPEPQRRLTVLVRLILVIPHAIVLFFLAIGAAVVAFLGWWGALFMGRLPDFAQNYLTGVVRWGARVYAYELLLTDAYPPFTLDDDPEYPVRVATTHERLNRWAVFFRFILVIPVNILFTVLAYGAGTVVLFITWIIALIAGTLPVSLHLAYAAVFRFGVRYYAYALLLTPTYPGGLFGDDPALPAAAPGFPGAPGGYGPPPGYGTTTAGYGAAPGTAPGGYGPPGPPPPAPGSYGAPGAAPGGYGTPGPYGPPPGTPGYGAPGAAPGYGATPGYGTTPGYATTPGYGAAPAYGASQPPAGWQLILTSGAKRLVVLFIVLGAIFYVGEIIAQQASGASNFSFNSPSPAAANTAVTNAYNTLNTQVSAFQTATNSCNGNISCLSSADQKAAQDFQQFGNTVQGTAMPSDAQADASTVVLDSSAVSSDLSQLSTATSAQQYESLVSSTGLESDSTKFDTDVSTLKSHLTADANS
jgi:hypothetical protein